MQQETNTDVASRSKFNIVEFARETQREITKVTWPTRKETTMTTVMIVVMALMAGMFFLFADWLLGMGVSRILGIAG